MKGEAGRLERRCKATQKVVLQSSMARSGYSLHRPPCLLSFPSGEPPLLFAWVDVLTFWAQCQYGDAALARYAEAEAICLRLSELPASADTAQRRRAEILRQRATIEEGLGDRVEGAPVLRVASLWSDASGGAAG